MERRHQPAWIYNWVNGKIGLADGSPVPVRQIYVTKGKGPGNE